MTREELNCWRGEHKMVEDVLTQITQAEERILKRLNCPTDPVVLDAMLNGKPPAPWPEHAAERDRRRALHAMHVLLNVASVRRETGRLDAGNSRVAAYHAILAGLYAGDAAANAVIAALARQTQRKATVHAAECKREARGRTDAEIRQVASDCRARHPKCSWNALAQYVLREMPDLQLAHATIRKRLPGLLK
ncbi:MAG: hypothetical protein IMZ67_06585 [Acidobacteria bacterium]|nr:hypothetical protein [Acidobacteriota bacterium]